MKKRRGRRKAKASQDWDWETVGQSAEASLSRARIEKGSSSLRIRDVRVILTAPAGINLVVVKVETSEPGLYGLGCATFTQRYLAVRTMVEEHLKPLLLGRDPSNIEDLWRLMHLNGYWRNGGVENNAISGVDMALWDILGKRAGLPVYQLLGGKCREAAAVYRHADGDEPSEIADKVRAYVNQGVRHVRVQRRGYGGGGLRQKPPKGAQPGAYFDPQAYTDASFEALAHVRKTLGDKVELLHDVHERLSPAQAMDFAKRLEPLRLFFLEDLLSPEDNDWFPKVRALCATPLAMGELFNHSAEWVPLISGRQIDFMRMHISQMGGLTPARKAAALGEIYGVRTAWHGPGDVSPVGHACNLHLDLASPNFGIQEFGGFSDALQDVFPGCPELKGGYLYPNAKPGFGMDLDEKKAARYPCQREIIGWTQSRLPDGSLSPP